MSIKFFPTGGLLENKVIELNIAPHNIEICHFECACGQVRIGKVIEFEISMVPEEINLIVCSECYKKNSISDGLNLI